jgi:hypothetical protein
MFRSSSFNVSGTQRVGFRCVFCRVSKPREIGAFPLV